MQRGYRILVASGILFATSISITFVWGITFSGLFIANNQGLLANKVTITTLHGYSADIHIDSIKRPLTLAIDSINNDQLKLRETVTGPSGQLISNTTFQKTHFSTIKPNKTGVYELSVVQLDDKHRDDATMYVLFGVLPFLKENGELELGVFTGFIAGIVLFTGGIISLIAGIIIAVKDRNRRQSLRKFIPGNKVKISEEVAMT